jgi:AraC-like DNA-binding protein
VRVSVGETDFLAAPTGSYVLVADIAYGCVDDDLFVTVLTRRPEPETVRKLMRLYAIEHARPPHRSLFDAGSLAGVDPDAFTILTDAVNDHRDVLGRILRRQAIVEPSGLPRAVVNGYRSVFDFPYPVRVFATRVEALAWLGRGDAHAAVDEIAAALERDPIVDQIASLLSADVALTLDDAAHRLGMSSRSLQRRLDAAGTSFRVASREAHVAAAKRQLVETDRKLTAIAACLGYRSLQSFSASFRQATGVTPSEWRQRSREPAK